MNLIYSEFKRKFSFSMYKNLKINLGRMSFLKDFINDTFGLEDNEIMSEFLRQYYEDSTFIPKTIMIECDIEDAFVMEKWISAKAGFKVSIKVPKRGENAKLIRMIKANAKKEHSERELKIMRDISFKNSALNELTQILRLKAPPMLIEAYDISNLGDGEIVASMVVYKDGKPHTKKYRNFKIKNVSHQDDYASMREVIFRRLKRAKQEEELVSDGKLKLEEAKFLPLPDVLFVDGGDGHRNTAQQVIADFGAQICVFGIVKDENHRTRGLVGPHGEIILDKKSDSFMLLTNIQDEMHRRAITYLRKLQDAKVSQSELENIKGVGEKKRKILLKEFRSLTRIKNASVEELRSVKGIDQTAANNIFEYFLEQRKQ